MYLVFPEGVHQRAIDEVDEDAENHGDNILDYRHIQTVPVHDGGEITHEETS